MLSSSPPAPYVLSSSAMSSFRSEPLPDGGDKDYRIDGEKIVFEIDEQAISLNYSEWQEIVADYSADGRNKTQAQIAIEHDVPRKILERMFRAAGIYKSSPPFTAEIIEEIEDEGGLENLVERSLEYKSQRFQAKLQRAELTALRKEVDELRTRERN